MRLITARDGNAANSVRVFEPPNALITDLARDFGGGCAGDWELVVHASGDDPFAMQTSSALPVVVVYRLFRAPPGTATTACAARLGLTPPRDAFVCGDAFVATMAAL